MTDVPSFREELISQIPALQLLRRLGYIYLNPVEALAARGGKLSNVLLEELLVAQLRKMNRIHYKGHVYQFSEDNIQEAVRKLKNDPYDGLVRTSEKIYDLLTLGTSLPQTIDGNTYNALAAFDTEDVAGIIANASEEVKKLPLYHAALWDVFKEVTNKLDIEAFQRFLEPEDRREQFYEALTTFAR